MILTIAGADVDGICNIYHEKRLVGITVDHPLDLTRTIIYDPNLEQIWADIRGGNMDDACNAIRERLQNGDSDL